MSQTGAQQRFTASFDLEPGTVGVVQLGSAQETIPPLCDLAQGLVSPEEGTVSFLGNDWKRMGPYQQGRNRGRIGRVAQRTSWVSNLSIFENMALRERHHTHRRNRDIDADIRTLADVLQVSDVINSPTPENLPQHKQRACEWIRAFLGTPDLVLLERPTQGVDPVARRALADLVRSALHRGAAVLWLTECPGISDCLQDVNPQIYHITNNTMTSMQEVS